MNTAVEFGQWLGEQGFVRHPENDRWSLAGSFVGTTSDLFITWEKRPKRKSEIFVKKDAVDVLIDFITYYPEPCIDKKIMLSKIYDTRR